MPELSAAPLDIQRSLFSAADFLGWMKAKQLNLNPYFQRRSVWSASAKSYFIDTIVRGLPVPIVFLRQVTDISTLQMIRDVVDGQQRLRTIISFIEPHSLPDLDPERDIFTVKRSHNPEIAGLSFDKLSPRLKKSILGYQFSAHVLPTDTSDAQVLDIFRRMNATGTRLSKQELRNAEFFGYFSQLVNSTALSFLEYWREWNAFTETNIARMEEVEFTSELFIVVLKGVSERSQGQISSTYKQYDDNFPEGEKVQARVTHVLETIHEEGGGWFGETDLRNKILFYPLFASLYDHMYGLGSSLADSSKSPRPDKLSRKMMQLAEVFLDRDELPLNVQEALLSRSNRKSNRLILKEFIDEFM